MDTLPIREEAAVSFAAQNGNLHACGHDLHTAMLLGVAKLLKAHKAALAGTVKLMFQPAEEIFEGVQDMIQSGLLENPKVSASLMIHVMAGIPMPAGTVIVSGPGVSDRQRIILRSPSRARAATVPCPTLGWIPLRPGLIFC